MRTKKRWAFISILLIYMVVMITSIAMAKADNWVGFQLSVSERIMAYETNGDILCSVLNDERELIAVKQIGHDGQKRWQCDFAEPYSNGTILFKEKDDGTGYIICGMPKSAKQYVVEFIDRNGQNRNLNVHNQECKPFAIVDTGILYSSEYDDENRKSMICFSEWNGNQIRGEIGGKLLYVRSSVLCDTVVCFDGIYENEKEQRVTAFFSMNLENGEIRKYDIGSDTAWTTQLIAHCKKGIVIVAYNGIEQYQLISCMDFSGNIEWQTKLSSSLYYPTTQVIKQNNKGNYELWGTAGVLRKGETYPELSTTYKIEIDAQGRLVDDMLGTYAGDCVQYKNDEVYVIDIDDMEYASLDTFHIDSRTSSPSFYEK